MLCTFLAGPGIISVHNPWFPDSSMFGECEGFSSNGDNPFFSLEPGFQLVLDGEEDGAQIHLTITVLNETKTIAGVKTRVVEERETIDGDLFEVSRKHYAICNRNNSVVYFGDDVDLYENRDIVAMRSPGTLGSKAQEPGSSWQGCSYWVLDICRKSLPEVALV